MVLDKWETVKHVFFKRDKQDHWEKYVFRLEDSFLRYYGDLKKKPFGELELSKVKHIKKVPHRYNYPFEIHFEGKNSPWILRARTGDVRNCWMESILVNSSSQPEPVSIAASEYDEITILPRDGEDQVKTQERRISNEREPMYPSNRGAKAPGEIVKEVIYDEPVQNHDKRPITDGESSHDSAPSKPDDNSAAACAIPMPEQFMDYTDDELERLAIALSETLKRRLGHGSDPKHNFMNEPRERHAETRHVHRRRIGHRDDVKLDTIFENNPIPENVAEYLDPIVPHTEIPPPLPIKKRRQGVHISPNDGDTVAEGRMGKGNPVQAVDEHFRKRFSGESRRRASLSKYTIIMFVA